MHDYKKTLIVAFVLAAVSACASFKQSDVWRQSLAVPLDTGAHQWWEQTKKGW